MKFDDVLVVGGSGFIGRHLVATLAGRGIQVTVPSRRRESAKHLILLPTVDVINGDVHDPATLARPWVRPAWFLIVKRRSGHPRPGCTGR